MSVDSEGEIAAWLNGRPADSAAANSAAGTSAADAADVADGDQPTTADQAQPRRLSTEDELPVGVNPTQPLRAALALDSLKPSATASGRLEGASAADGATAPGGVGDGERPRGDQGGAALVTDVGRTVIGWARDRSIGSNSLQGVCVALALCAAAWFSAGTRTDNFRAVVALWAAYLTMAAARSLASLPDRGRRTARVTAAMRARLASRSHWLASLGWSVSECACFAGLAAGATADHWSGTWTLAIAVLGLIAVRDLMAACSGQGQGAPVQGGTVRQTMNLFLTMPPGGRVLLIGIVAPGWGGRAALFALLDWAIIAACYGLAGSAGQAGSKRAAPRQEAAPDQRAAHDDPAQSQWPGSLVLLLSPSGEELTRSGQTNVDADQASRGGYSASPAEPPAEHISSRAAPVVSPAAAARIVRLRDDGALARRLGRPVRGNLLPLIPAILGVFATAMLTFLGLRGLPLVLILAPVLIMLLLAAPGSSNAHTGRLDWLVPAVLLGWQFLYLTAVGSAAAVPGPATFALGAALALRYADLAFVARPVMLARALHAGEQPRESGTALGWEGRMLLLGVGAAVGIGTFVCLALTAYIGVLLFAKVLASPMRLGAEDAR